MTSRWNHHRSRLFFHPTVCPPARKKMCGVQWLNPNWFWSSPCLTKQTTAILLCYMVVVDIIFTCDRCFSPTSTFDCHAAQRRLRRNRTTMWRSPKKLPSPIPTLTHNRSLVSPPWSACLLARWLGPSPQLHDLHVYQLVEEDKWGCATMGPSARKVGRNNQTESIVRNQGEDNSAGLSLDFFVTASKPTPSPWTITTCHRSLLTISHAHCSSLP
jgi:hypothetical protein